MEWRAINEAIAATGLRIMGVSGCKIPRLKTEIDRAGIPLLTEGKRKSLSSGTVRTHPAAASC
ncbi:septum formation inhibitor [Klebsiella pneumoniae]|nr:septum formation inhibitor [Klebsiella pneumoniae]